MYKKAGLVYKGARGSHHQFEDPKTGKKYTLAGKPSKELGPRAWEVVQSLLREFGHKR
jgi:predicted RNA binding protein YcfA (HicA-like mRNA interferase family)